MNNNNENADVQGVKHTVFDSVFKDLFGDINNVRKVYLKLHPKDTDVTVDDIQIKTLKTILMQGIVNDLSFTVRNKLLMMLEAQTNWSRNIAFRLFEYAAKSLENYVKLTEQDVYGDKLLELPTIELYVLYTGNISEEEKIDYLSFADLYAQGNREFIDVRVKVIYGDDGNDVLCQYAEFVRVLRMCFVKYGRTEEAVKEAIRICKDRDVLRQYLTEKEAEVVSVMQMLFDQDYIWDVHVKSEVRQEREKGILITIASLRDFNLPEVIIMHKIMERYNLDQNTAEKYMAMAVNDVTK